MAELAVAPDQNAVSTRSTLTGMIDCDIHNTPQSPDAIAKHMPDRWREHHRKYSGRNYVGSYYPRALPNAARHDAFPPSGFPPGSDLDFMREQLLDEWGFEYGVLNCLIGVGGQLNLEYGAAFARAVNDWQIAEFLEPEPRLKGSIIIPYEDGNLAAEEIDRVARHPGYVQALFAVRTSEPMGRRKYWPIYEAAQRNDTPIAVHFGGAGGGPITGSGWPSHYIEDHGGMPQSFQPQITSLIYEGVFERYPNLKVVLIEGGFGYMPPLMWRLDRAWELMGDEIPNCEHRPSETVRKHIWMTTQPVEEPDRNEHFHQLLAQMDMNDRLMFATDYPHWDFDAPDRCFPPGLDPIVKQNILSENARGLYQL